VAARWTLIDRSAGPLLDLCADRGVSVVAAAPFNSGLLASPHPPDDARFDYEPAPAELLARARAMAAACEQRGRLLPEAALQFPLRHPAVVSVVAGMKSPGEAVADTSWMSAALPDDLWATLDEQLT
jgi:D-threo-aldose 1-dehydrogenase